MYTVPSHEKTVMGLEWETPANKNDGWFTMEDGKILVPIRSNQVTGNLPPEKVTKTATKNPENETYGFPKIGGKPAK